MKTLRLSEALGTNQIFTRIMSQHTDLPWSEDTSVSAAVLDFEYLYNFSGGKLTSPAIDKNLGSGDVIETAAFNMLCEVAYMMYNKKWARNWEVLTAEYNPLNNYDMVETETPAEITHTISPAETTRTDTPAEITHTITPAETTETESPAETTNTIKPAKTTVENEVSAFNSSSYEDSSKTTTAGDATDKGTDVFTVNTSGSTSIDVDTAGSDVLTVQHAATSALDVDTAGSDALTVQNARELTRSGNIGVTTSAQLLTGEIELWKWNFFYDVFKDIDSVFTISTY